MLVKKYSLGLLFLVQTLQAIPPHGTTTPSKPIPALSKPQQPESNSVFSSCFPTGCTTGFACFILAYLPFKDTPNPLDRLKTESLGFSPLKTGHNRGISS